MNPWGASIGVMIAILLIWLVILHFSKKSTYKIDDLITRDGVHLSTTKILQLIGGIVATWVVIKMTVLGTMTWEIFALYLAFAASIDGFTKLLQAKYGHDNRPTYWGRGQKIDDAADPRLHGGAKADIGD